MVRMAGRNAKVKPQKAPKRTGIEKYGQDDADAFLDLDGDVFKDVARPTGVTKQREVMALKKKADKGGDQEEEEQEYGGSSTKGWQQQDFYGGDDVGDDEVEGDSDEEMMLEEARRLEQVRARRLQSGVADPLAALLGGRAKETKPKGKKAKAKEEKVSVGEGVGMQFDSLLGADVEHGAVQKDLSQLGDAQRKGMLQTQAPELVPLLTDFKGKLEELQNLLPLLSPQAQAHIQPTGVEYLQSKAMLLLNTLANLSFYVVLRAEGGAVRSHPVISQLVWLRELQEEFRPVDTQVAPAVAEAKKDWERLQGDLQAQAEQKAAAVEEPAEQAPPRESRRLTLREKLQLIKEQRKKQEAAVAAAAPKDDAQKRLRLSTEDLFRLPSAKRARKGPVDGPADLEEADPLLGPWRPQGSLATEMLHVRQKVGERTEAPKADMNVEAQPLRPRQRMRESQEEVDASEGKLGRKQEEELAPEDRKAKAKQAKKEAQEEARRKALAAQQFKPEEVLEGRRATSQKILRNRGLVRQRKKYSGNARVANRKKHEKAVKRHKGAVQQMREGAADGTYEGEATGVRRNLKKSTKLG